MIAAIAWLLVCQLVGEILARAFALPLPGPVAGMGLMFVFLVIQGRHKSDDEDRVPKSIGRVADALLGSLSLLFVPAAVGVVQYLDIFRRFGWAIGFAVVLSTGFALLSTVLVFRLGAKVQTHFRRQHSGEDALEKT